MELEPSIVRRLAFIRYLSQMAISQTRVPAPLKCASILMMHDSVELFLQLACEYHNIETKEPRFMEYWDLINAKLNIVVGQKESMKRLNKSRVALKHHGAFPSDLDIEQFVSATIQFFRSNTPPIFSIEYDQISLIDFVNPEDARNDLKQVKRLLVDNKLQEAVNYIALAFAKMIYDYEKRKYSPYYGSPFCFYKRIEYHTSTYAVDEDWHKAINSSAIKEFAKDVSKALDSIREILKILSLGLDIKKFTRFNLLTPDIVLLNSGEWMVHHDPFNRIIPIREDVDFCMDFVIESALLLSEFDYSIETEDISLDDELFE